jgi:hypothetical protein
MAVLMNRATEKRRLLSREAVRKIKIQERFAQVLRAKNHEDRTLHQQTVNEVRGGLLSEQIRLSKKW